MWEMKALATPMIFWLMKAASLVEESQLGFSIRLDKLYKMVDTTYLFIYFSIGHLHCII